jgi:probable HAF family extracellular repeat protein
MKKVFQAALSLTVMVLLVSGSKAATYNFVDLDYPGQGNYISGSRGINDLGVISGSYGTGTTGTGFWKDGNTFNTFTIAPYTNAVGINDAGLIVGTSGSSGFIYNTVNQSYQTYDVAGASSTSFFGINDMGQVVGWYRDSSSNNHGIIYDRGTGNYTFLNYLGATSYTLAFGINDNGIVVGCYNSGGTDHGFIYQNGIFSPLDYPNSDYTRAVGINDLGQIVGRFKYNRNDANDIGFIYDNGIFSMLQFSGADDLRPTTINNIGQITGMDVKSDGSVHGFLANPVPLPGGLLLLGSGLLGLAGWRRIRKG